jgi:hypothetical protein
MRTRWPAWGAPLLVAQLMLGCVEPPPAPRDVAPVDDEGGGCFVPSTGVSFEDFPLEDCPHFGDCVDDYLELGERFPAELAPTPIAEILADLEAASLGEIPVLAAPADPDQLREDIVQGAALGFLLDGLFDAPIRLTSVPADDPLGPMDYVLEDPIVGRFSIRVMLPDAPPPFPGLVVAHGHGEAGWEFLGIHPEIQEVREEGYAVVLPTFRASEADEVEDLVTRTLLQDGFTFMALRVYEQLVATKVLLALDGIDPCRVGLIGHSGGSVAGNLTVRVERRFAAYVSDLQSDFSGGWTGDPDMLLTDETAPSLFPFSAQVNDFTTSVVPVLPVSYSYPEGSEPIREFLTEAMSARP